MWRSVLETVPLQGEELLHITTLFNIFCPITLSLGHMLSLFRLVACYISLLLLVLLVMPRKNILFILRDSLFPRGSSKRLLSTGFIVVALLNLLSLVCYSFPVTTTLGFNLGMAL